ncbi:MAG TPA: histidine kinase dimerization/phospho-acceptor domain-containing protein, partial [Planctomycetota bacterium]|nr:histidine kinase dimerization/phospho-acceptor domain-containing protein [Planctomycetota bacterium]
MHAGWPVIGLLAEAGAGVALAAVVALGAIWLSMRSRLRELNAALRSMAEGDLDSALPPAGKGVIGELTGGIAAMADTLRSNYEELKTNDELRRRLIANVSHELRTPLVSVIGYTDMLLSEHLGPLAPDQRKALHVCARNT